MSTLGQAKLLLFGFVAFGVILIVASVVGCILWLHHVKKRNAELRNLVLSGRFISLDDFESNWIADRPSAKRGMGHIGYKYNDMAGCYVILIFGEVPNEGFSNYENSYIGQSVNVCQRVHNHFNGKGNGDVYADRKFGKLIYVQFFPCARENMNSLEKSLIAAFDSTASYNKTKGGSRQY